jgi:branched-chain amino acid transport system permease protein
MGELILQTCLNAVIASSFAAIFAVGLVLIFGIMQVVNFAHGELYMAGAYALWFLYAENNLPFFAAIILAVLVVIVIGLFMEIALFRWKRGDQLGGLILSVGMLFVLQVLAVHFFGHGLMKNVTAPLHESWHVFGLENVSLPYQRLVVLGVTCGLLASFWVFLRKSRLGAALRACTQDPEAAQLQGMNLNKIAMFTMAVSAGMAGAGGAVMAPLVKVVPNMGHSVIITALIVIIVGGVGSLEGAVIAAIFYSFIHTFMTTFVGSVFANILGLVLMLLVLVVRPAGIMATSEKV